MSQWLDSQDKGSTDWSNLKWVMKFSEQCNSVKCGPLIPALDKGFVPTDEDKNAAYEAACPSGLEFK